jgi:adhesin transport system outer membrane protein
VPALFALVVMLVAGSARAQTLRESVERALRTFPEVRSAQANRSAVEQTVPQARAGLLPSLDGTLGRGRERTNSSLTRSRADGPWVALNRQELEVTMSQLLYDGGSTWNALKRQEARFQSAAEQVGNVSENVALRTAQAFFEVLRVRALIELAAENLAVHRRTLEQVSSRTEKGLGRRSDDRQTEARVALAESTLTQLRGQLDEAETAYRHLTGTFPGELLRAEAELGGLPRGVEQAVEDARVAHPAVRAAELELEAAAAERESARGRLLPRLTLELGATQDRDVDGLQGLNADRTAMLRLRHNFFRGGADSARISEAEARRYEALEQLARVRNDIERDVRQAWQSLAAERSRLTVLRTYADASAEVIEAYRSQFRIGQRSLLDVLNAENENFGARSNMLTSSYAVDTGVYRLLAAMGRMLEHLGLKPAAKS